MDRIIPPDDFPGAWEAGVGDYLAGQFERDLQFQVAAYHPERLWELERYYHGYRALHGYTGARVLFAAIVGVPEALVDQAALAEVDWNDDAQREAHYQKILDAPAMTEVVDDRGTSEVADDNLRPSCESEFGKAYPPRRIVSLARMFGRNSLVQSICGDNLGPPIEIIIRQVVESPE
jgi:hypothetical protein